MTLCISVTVIWTVASLTSADEPQWPGHTDCNPITPTLLPAGVYLKTFRFFELALCNIPIFKKALVTDRPEASDSCITFLAPQRIVEWAAFLSTGTELGSASGRRFPFFWVTREKRMSRIYCCNFSLFLFLEGSSRKKHILEEFVQKICYFKNVSIADYDGNRRLDAC